MQGRGTGNTQQTHAVSPCLIMTAVNLGHRNTTYVIRYLSIITDTWNPTFITENLPSSGTNGQFSLFVSEFVS